jgi:hypothetical protein
MSIEKIKLAAAWLLLASTATLLRFKVTLNSDTLFLDSLFTDLFQHGGRWTEWKFVQAPAFVPDMLLYLIAYPLWPDAPGRIFAVSAAQVLLLGAAALWCARQVAPQLSRSAQAALLLLLAYVTLTASASGMWFYFYSTNNHLGATMAGLVGLGLLLRHLAAPRWSTALLLVLLMAAAKASTRLFALTFVTPLVVLAALALIALPKQSHLPLRWRRRAWRLLGLLAASQLLASALEALLIRNIPYEGHAHASPETVGNSLKLFMQATAAAFSPSNHWVQALAVVLLLVLGYLLVALLRRLELDPAGPALRWPRLGGDLGWRYGAAAALLCVALPVTVAGSVLSSGFGDLNSYRYFTFPLTLACVLAVILLDHHHRRRALAWHVGAVLGAAVIVAGAVQVTRQQQPNVDMASNVADCLKAIEAGGFPLKAGIGDYWNGSAISYYLPRHNPVTITTNDTVPMFWVTTLGPLLRPQNYPAHQHYNFALLRDNGAGGQFDYTPDTIGKLLPPPSRVQACPVDRLQIWLYDGDQLDTAMARVKADYLARRAAKK